MKTLQKTKINQRFLRTRSDHQSERTEDYVEAILDEIDIDGRAQLTEIAQRLGVKHPTAAKALKKLSARGLVTVEPYRGVTLTNEGLSLAVFSRDRHKVVFNFLCSIGLDEKTAELDAEGIEHHVSPKTIAAMRKFIKPSS
jgi:DtxR family manganese transport transcriptional regulator